MSRGARILLAGSYFTLLVLVVWPLIETPSRIWTRQSLAVIGVALLTLAALTPVPRWASIAAAVLNVVIGVCSAAALLWAATHGGFDPIQLTELPGIVYFLVFAPLVGAVLFFQQARQARQPAQVQPNPSLGRP